MESGVASVRSRKRAVWRTFRDPIVTGHYRLQGIYYRPTAHGREAAPKHKEPSIARELLMSHKDLL